MTQRRLVLLTLGASLSGHAALLRAQAPAAGLRRVGVLMPSTRAKEEITLKPFFDQMHELGWIEEKTIAYDPVFADDQPDRLPALAAQLVARGPELIYAPPSVSAVAARARRRRFPSCLPLRMTPWLTGWSRAWGGPGGNVTGVSSMTTELSAKKVQLLHEMLPGMKRLGLIGDAGDPNTKIERQVVAAAATTLGIQVVHAEFTQPGDLDAGFAKLVAQRPDAVYVLEAALTLHLRARLSELASQTRLPAVPFTSGGGPFSYASSLNDRLRRSAQMIDKILRRAKPADIPVEQPTLFWLVVNLKAAKALGLTVPPSVLLRADDVIR